MVLKKRLDYGFNGHQIPIVPRAPRSVRRRRPTKKAVGDDQICPFELLAAVAGKLLQENESSSTSSNAYGAKDLLGIHTECVKEERLEHDNKASKTVCLDQGSCVESVFIPELAAKPIMDDIPIPANDSFLDHISNLTSSESSKKVDCELKLGVCNSKVAEGEVGDSLPLKDPCDGRVENETVNQLEEDLINHSKDLTAANTCSVKKQVEKSVYSEQLINSDNSVQLSLYRDQKLPSASFLRRRNDLHLGIRDNEENSFRCNKFSTKIRAFRPQSRNYYGRIREKRWKTVPKLRDYGLSNTNDGARSIYRSRKRYHSQERYQQEVPFKKRMLHDRSFEVDNDQEISSESISNSPEGIMGDKYTAEALLQRGNGVSTSVNAHRKKKDSKVKFSIKSFKVPELYIEVPETDTIGSLKRTVMETVTAILGGGLRVGLVVQGKRVRDDNRTLQQAGIYSSNLDTLGFILEPNCTQVAEISKDSAHLYKIIEPEKSSRPPSSTILDSGLLKMDNGFESNDDMIALYGAHDNDPLTDEPNPDSKALVSVPVPISNAEPLAVVPMNRKNKRSESSQRRTRRPFSVAEVEALVEAVEVLGAGRWRDVKMRAFENADHRTYVDLKDKWKTLVHTASISSQQRRGEPVPQELLDRVLSAHSYWSKNQPKQHSKIRAETLKAAIDTRGEPMEV